MTAGAGYCEVINGGTCVTDGDDDYKDHERCTVRAEVAVSVTATVLDTESYFDYVTIGGTRYSGTTNRFTDVHMAAV